MSVRATAAAIVFQVVGQGRLLDSVLDREDAQVSVRDQGLLRELCYGTLRWYPRFEVVLNHLLDKPLKSKDADLYALLACALYQLTATRIPPHAAINETVAACQTLGKGWAKGLVNAILRRYQREQGTFEGLFKDCNAYWSAHPDWLLSAIRDSWPDQLEAIVEANNSRAPMTLRVNQLRCRREDYLLKLVEAGIAASPTSFSEVGIQLDAPQPVVALPGFEAGLVSVQDEAAQLCAQLLDPAPGQRVLDACSAPGGKACHLLEYQPEIRELVALELDAERLHKVEDNLARLGLSARTLCADAARPDQWWDGTPFERILLDTPCSASGVIRRHPDIKVLRKPADIAKLVVVQATLLEQLWPALAPGGILLYATCSILTDENDRVVSEFVQSRSDASLLPVVFEEKPKPGLATGHVGQQLLPGVGGHDGFYYALLEKQ